MRRRITEADLRTVLLDVSRLLNDDLHLGVPTLHQGSHEYGIANHLILNQTDLFRDCGGTTRRDAYEALVAMRNVLTLAVEHQAMVRRLDAALDAAHQTCAHEVCGYGDCSWLHGGNPTERLCDQHVNYACKAQPCKAIL